MSRVMIDPAAYETVRPAVDHAFDLFPLSVKGKSVLIKPNVLRAAKPEEAITTHPAVLDAVVEKIESMGAASIVVGDNPGLVGYGANEESFRKSGLLEAARGHYQNIGNDSRKVDFNPEFMPSVGVSRIVLDADIVISLPKFKTHGLSVVTGAIKNSYGFLPGAQKAKLHKAAGCAERFHEMLVDVFRLRVPDLFLVDAVVGMEGNGPAYAQGNQIPVSQHGARGNGGHAPVQRVHTIGGAQKIGRALRRAADARKLGHTMRFNAHFVAGLDYALGDSVMTAPGAERALVALVVGYLEADAVDFGRRCRRNGYGGHVSSVPPGKQSRP